MGMKQRDRSDASDHRPRRIERVSLRAITELCDILAEVGCRELVNRQDDADAGAQTRC